MRDEEKLAMLGNMTGETSESILSAYLNHALSALVGIYVEVVSNGS